MKTTKSHLYLFIVMLFFSLSALDCGEDTAVKKAGEDASANIKDDTAVTENDGTKEGANLVMYYFYGRGCKSCREIEYDIDQLPEKYKNKGFALKKFEVWHDDKNRSMLIRMAKERGKRKGQLGTPTTIVGKDVYVGNKLDRINSLIKKNL